MATLFEASSPNTTCKKVMMLKAITKATVWTTLSGTRGASSGSMSVATAGSPKAPRPSEAMVMPPWRTRRPALSKGPRRRAWLHPDTSCLVAFHDDPRRYLTLAPCANSFAQWSRSVEQLLIQLVAEWLAVQVAPEVVAKELRL